VTNRLSLLSHFFGIFPLWISSKNGSSGFLASHVHQAGCCATRVANRAGLRAFEPTISDNGLLRQPETGFQAGLDTGSSRGKDLLHQLSVRRVKSNLFLRGTSIRQGVALPFSNTAWYSALSADSFGKNSVWVIRAFLDEQLCQGVCCWQVEKDTCPLFLPLTFLVLTVTKIRASLDPSIEQMIKRLDILSVRDRSWGDSLRKQAGKVQSS